VQGPALDSQVDVLENLEGAEGFESDSASRIGLL